MTSETGAHDGFVILHLYLLNWLFQIALSCCMIGLENHVQEKCKTFLLSCWHETCNFSSISLTQPIWRKMRWARLNGNSLELIYKDYTRQTCIARKISFRITILRDERAQFRLSPASSFSYPFTEGISLSLYPTTSFTYTTFNSTIAMLCFAVRGFNGQIDWITVYEHRMTAHANAYLVCNGHIQQILYIVRVCMLMQ